MWASEEVILASASNMQRDILVYMAVNKISPIVYSPILIGPKLQPIRVGFFEPGHYCPVFEYPSQSPPTLMNETAQGGPASTSMMSSPTSAGLSVSTSGNDVPSVKPKESQ